MLLLEHDFGRAPEPSCFHETPMSAGVKEVRVCLKDAYSPGDCKDHVFKCDFSGGFDHIYMTNEEKNSQLISRSQTPSEIDMGTYGFMRSENLSVQSGGFGPCYAVGVVNRACQTATLGHFSALTHVNRSVDALVTAVHEESECSDKKSSSEFFLLLSLESYQSLDDYAYRRLICGIRSRYPEQKITIRTAKKSIYQTDRVEIKRTAGKMQVVLNRFGETNAERKTATLNLD
jgi:hypothetical protein